MLVNDFKDDFQNLTKASNISQSHISAKTGIAQPNIGRTFAGQVITKNFIAICEAMGFDVKVVYVKKGAK